MKTSEADAHFEFYYGWNPNEFESIKVKKELSNSPKLVLKMLPHISI